MKPVSMFPGIETINLLLICLLGVLPTALQTCTHFVELMEKVEMCNDDFTSSKTLVLRGELTATNRPDICKVYDKTTECIETVIADCQVEDTEQLVHAQTVLNDHVQGFGKLCDEDSSFFQEYESAGPCYARHAVETAQCLDAFTTTVQEWHHAQIENDYNYEEDYGNPSICKSIQTMYACVESAVTSCGSQAASMYAELCQFHVPRDLEGHCMENKPRWDEVESSGAHLSTCIWLVTASPVFRILY